MKRTLLMGLTFLFAWLGLVSASEAQVFIRAPFVRVGVGDGISVRAPFVNIYIPPGPRVVYMPGPGVVQPGQPTLQPGQPMPPAFVPPSPQPLPKVEAKDPGPAPKPEIKDDAPPQPINPVDVPTLESFAKTFKPKAGNYEVTILNPVTKQPTAVRFILPEGAPRRTHVSRDSIEFVYGLRQWVRIEFDRDGVQVTAR